MLLDLVKQDYVVSKWLKSPPKYYVCTELLQQIMMQLGNLANMHWFLFLDNSHSVHRTQ